MKNIDLFKSVEKRKLERWEKEGRADLIEKEIEKIKLEIAGLKKSNNRKQQISEALDKAKQPKQRKLVTEIIKRRAERLQNEK